LYNKSSIVNRHSMTQDSSCWLALLYTSKFLDIIIYLTAHAAGKVA